MAVSFSGSGIKVKLDLPALGLLAITTDIPSRGGWRPCFAARE